LRWGTAVYFVARIGDEHDRDIRTLPFPQQQLLGQFARQRALIQYDGLFRTAYGLQFALEECARVRVIIDEVDLRFREARRQ
jgi:hypothetical protein